MMMLAEVVTEDTGVSIGLIVTIATIVSSVIFSIVSILWSIRARLGRLVSDFKRLEDEQWTIMQQCEYQLRLKIENPAFRVPDPRDPSKMLGEAS